MPLPQSLVQVTLGGALVAFAGFAVGTRNSRCRSGGRPFVSDPNPNERRWRMLARKHYTREEIDRGRERIEAGIAAWSALPAEAADERLEAAYFEALVLALDRLFVHRQRGLEGRPPTALGEVRDTAEAIAAGQDGPGGRAAFEDLARRFFAGLEARFGPES